MATLHTAAPTCNAPRARRISLLSVLLGYLSLWRQRQTLDKLDDSLLKDIGITRSQARKEARRPFWDAPHNWR